MSDLRTSARCALGKGAILRRSAPLEPMAHVGSYWRPASLCRPEHCQSLEQTVIGWSRHLAS
eukprot:1522667-Amphidinium_carterae.3